MMLLEHTCDIKRNAAVGTNGRRQLSDLYTDVSCLALPMGLSTAISNGFSLGKAYDVFFAAGQDVKPGDKLIIDGADYTVKGVQPFNVPTVGHVRALCVQEIS
jgi:hypothetical protein